MPMLHICTQTWWLKIVVIPWVQEKSTKLKINLIFTFFRLIQAKPFLSLCGSEER